MYSRKEGGLDGLTVYASSGMSAELNLQLMSVFHVVAETQMKVNSPPGPAAQCVWSSYLGAEKGRKNAALYLAKVLRREHCANL